MGKLGPYTLGPGGKDLGIFTGDSRTLAEEIPDASIDIIITDPPYLRPDLPIYEWLVETAGRVLKEGGFLFAYGGAEFTPEILGHMERGASASGVMRYFYTFSLLHNGGYPRIWYKRLMSGYKPIFIYVKGEAWKKRSPWMATTHSDKKDKDHHRWGQGDGFAIKMLDVHTEPGAVVWDPFTGGGPTMSAAYKTGRSFLGFELDPEQAEKARERVRVAPDPLFLTSSAGTAGALVKQLEIFSGG